MEAGAGTAMVTEAEATEVMEATEAGATEVTEAEVEVVEHILTTCIIDDGIVALQISPSEAHPKYEFAYGVVDHKTGDKHGQKESRDGDKVVGEYTVKEPGGNVRTVKYYADKKGGFHAHVHNSGGNDHSGGTYGGHGGHGGGGGGGGGHGGHGGGGGGGHGGHGGGGGGGGHGGHGGGGGGAGHGHGGHYSGY
ncbi:Cuticle protein 21 [Gryllus bimaculatus]|nr:Cuticle protein 21 [Gryllus bimaculatus]